MAEYPGTVLEKLDDPSGRTELVVKLRELANQATIAQTETDLTDLADAVNQLVEDSPALSTLLRTQGPPTVDRTEQTFPESPYVSQYATQIHEHLNRLRTQAPNPSSEVEEYDLEQIFRTIRQRDHTSAERGMGFGQRIPGVHNIVRNYTGELTQIQSTFSF
jgi:hypothetical protein